MKQTSHFACQVHKSCTTNTISILTATVSLTKIRWARSSKSSQVN